MIDWLAGKLGYVHKSTLTARFDAASNDYRTRRHWAKADGLSADASCDEATRRTLRMRARHEFLNNPYMYGAVYTLANDTIGVGPRLQMLTGNESVNQAVERQWALWAAAVGLAAKLRLMRMTRIVSGECFLRFVYNPAVKHPVKLDIQLFEADQIATPDRWIDPRRIDGIEFDAYGNPAFYHVLRQHPGDVGRMGANPLAYDVIPASEMLHYFRPDRPGQSRGIPETVSSINLQAMRRQMRESVLMAAKTAASLGAVMLETDNPAAGEVATTPGSGFDEFDISPGMMTTLPIGVKARQMEPAQPSMTYGDFDDRLIGEQGRPLQMPKNIAKADSSDYNYASGRLDHQTYDRSIQVEQSEIDLTVLNPTFHRWAIMATDAGNLLPRRAGQVFLPTRLDPEWPIDCSWSWAEREHIDPAKEADGQRTRFENKTTTFAAEFARERRDWRDEIAQAGRERVALDAAGLLQISPQAAPQIVGVLRAAASIGLDATVGALEMLGVPPSRAMAMAESAIEATPEPAPPAAFSRNGNGLPKTSSTGGGL